MGKPKGSCTCNASASWVHVTFASEPTTVTFWTLPGLDLFDSPSDAICACRSGHPMKIAYITEFALLRVKRISLLPIALMLAPWKGPLVTALGPSPWMVHGRVS